MEIEAFLIKTKVYFRLFEELCVKVRSASNDDGSFSLGMQAERNFDCGRELSFQKNARTLGGNERLPSSVLSTPQKTIGVPEKMTDP
jgi:hypothetical protein